MFRRVLLLSFLVLPACASVDLEKKHEEEAAAAAEATDTCIANPALAQKWGECNVKSTIYNSRAAIGACQRRFAKEKASGAALMLKIRIGAEGAVKDVTVDDSVHPANKRLESCLTREIRKLRFAAPPKGVKPIVYYPYVQP